MKQKSLAFTLLSVVAVAVACNKEPTASEQTDNLKTKATAAAQDMKSYTYGQKTEFVTFMQGQLDDLKKLKTIITGSVAAPLASS